MNQQQYLALKHELGVATALVHACIAQIDRMEARLKDLEEARANTLTLKRNNGAERNATV